MTQYNGLYKFRRVLSVILTMAVLLMMTPIWGSTADAAETTHDHDNSGWIEWTSSNTLPTNSGNYYLTNNVTYTTNMWIDINSGNTVNICLNGNNITFTQNAGYYRVNNGAELNIYDCSDICGTITCKNPIRTYGNMTLYNGNIVCESGSGLLINEGGDLTIKGGHISGSDRGVFANKDTNITMTGGTVEGNVGITSHSMHISGGTVIGNTTGISGFDQLTVSGDAKISAVENAIGFSNDGTLIIEGGMIESSNDRYNTIAISTRCYVEISGGVIKGGYCINTMSDIVLSGTPTIETASASFDLSTANSANPKLIITEKLDSNVCYSVRTDCLYDRGFYVFTDSSDTNFNVLANFEPSSELETYNGGYIIIKKSNGQLALAQNIYTVTYDGGKHGEGEIEAASEPTGTSAALSSEKFTRTGYIQTGWATEDGGEKVYGFGDTYSDDTDITLYPVWTKCGHDSEDPKWTDDNNDNGTHSRICDDCGATVTKPHSYDKGEVTRPATETEEGEMTYTCEECGATKTDDIPATGGSTGDGSEDDNPGGNNDDNNDPGNVNVDSKSGANAPSVSMDKETSDKLKAEIIANHLT
ncbi:MAG: InlB B-repeat-containing protein, partial [Oscillospiraceae bacterium]|nr:InlB B-repeat-containing protein [Oscillospiraceae bacterium]